MSIGKALKEIRIHKGISQKEAAGGIVSPSFYAKVEKDQSHISADLLFAIIDNLNVDLDEFRFIENGYQEPLSKQLLSRCVRYYTEIDIKKLRELKNEVDQLHEKEPRGFLERLSIILYCLIEGLLHEEGKTKYDANIVQPVKDYLFAVETWGWYEITLFRTCAMIFDIDTVLLLANQALKNLRHYSGFDAFESDVLLTIGNIVISCLRYDYIDEADYYLHLAKRQQKNPTLLFERNALYFLEGISDIKKGNTVSGIEKSQRSIQIFYDLGLENYSQKYQEYLDQVIEEGTKI